MTRRLSRAGLVGVAMRLSGASLFGLVCQTVTWFVHPRVLGPHDYGLWQLIGLLVGYSAYTHLGVAQALRREIPVLLGRGDVERAAYVRDVGTSVPSLFAAVYVFGLWVAYLAGGTFGGEVTVPMMLVMSATALVVRYSNAYSNALTGYARFDALAYYDVAMPLLFLFSSIPLVLTAGLEGLMVANLISLVGAYLLQRRKARLELTWRADWREGFRLIRVGFPIMANLLLRKLFETLEMLVGSAYYSLASVGTYGFALTMFNVMDLLPSSLNGLTQQRMALDYGKAQERAEAFRPYFRAPLALYVFVGATVSQVLFFVFEAVVQVAFVDYFPSLTVLAWLVLGYPFFGLRLFSGLSFSIMKRNGVFTSILIPLMVINLGLDIYLASTGAPMVTLAMVATGCYVVFGVSMLLLASRAVFGTMRAGLSVLSRVGGALAVSLAVFFWMRGTPEPTALTWSGVTGVVGLGLSKVAATLVVNVAAFAACCRAMGFAGHLSAVAGDAFSALRRRGTSG